jgi:AraC-like DNA-binding protein
MIQGIATFRPTPGRLVLPDVCCDIAAVDGRLFLTGPLTHARPSPHIGRDVLLLRVSIIAIRALLRMPLAELADRVIPLDEVDRGLASMVADHLHADRTAEFLELASPDTTDRRFLLAARALAEGDTVSSAAQRVSLCGRQLERLFADRVGVAPKTFSRIVRFRRAVLDVCSGTPLAIAAATHGYADQAHFSREVRALTGLAPRALLERIPHVAFVQDVATWGNVGCE